MEIRSNQATEADILHRGLAALGKARWASVLGIVSVMAHFLYLVWPSVQGDRPASWLLVAYPVALSALLIDALYRR